MNKPIQSKIYNQLKDNILSKKWQHKLPAHSALCEEFSVNPKTLRKVVDQLVMDGLLDVRHGIGTFIRKQGDHDNSPERILLIVPFMRGVFISSLVKEFISYQKERENVEIMVVGYDDNYLEEMLPNTLAQCDRAAILLLNPPSPAIKRCLNEYCARGRLLALNTKISEVKSMVVTGDSLAAGKEAVYKLNEQGYRKIAFFKSGNVNKVNLRLKGYEKGIEILGLTYKKVVSYQMTSDWFDSCFRRMIEKKELPQVLIFDWHPASIVAYIALVKIDARLAEKVKFLVFDPGETEKGIGFLAMNQPLRRIVETTVKLLTGKTWKCRSVDIPVEFVDYSEFNHVIQLGENQ